MSEQYDIFDNLNSYLNNTGDCGIPEDIDDSNNETSFIELESTTVVGKKRTTKQNSSPISDKRSSPRKKRSGSKTKTDAFSMQSAEVDSTLLASNFSDKSVEIVSLSPPSPTREQRVSNTVDLGDDLDQQINEVTRHYDLLISKGKCNNPSEKRFFADLKKQYQALMRQRNAPRRRSRQTRPSTFLDELIALKEMLYDICVNRNLMAPISTFPAPEPSGRRTRSNRQPVPEVVSLDSDEEDVAKSTANNSFDSENYEVSIKIKWKGSIERHTLRKHQKFVELIAKLAKDVNVEPCRVILDVNERIIDPNDTPDSIGYRITQFITGRVVEKSVVGMFVGSQSKKASKSTASLNTITLKVQSDRWKTPLEIAVGKDQKMCVVIIKCAEELKCAAGQIKLSFDGEPVEMDSTPSQLDLEDGEILDLRFVRK